MMAKKDLIFKILSVTAVILCMVLIFAFSAENSEESADTSKGISLFITRLFTPDFESMSDMEKQAVLKSFTGAVRTAAHFSVFALLGFLSANALNCFVAKPVIRTISAIIFGFLYAVSDEIHQHFVPGRACEIKDVAIDTAGVIVGTLFFAAVLFTINKLTKKKPNGN